MACVLTCSAVVGSARTRGAGPRCRLSFEEREEISRGLAANLSLRAIAAAMGARVGT